MYFLQKRLSQVTRVFRIYVKSSFVEERYWTMATINFILDTTGRGVVYHPVLWLKRQCKASLGRVATRGQAADCKSVCSTNSSES